MVYMLKYENDSLALFVLQYYIILKCCWCFGLMLFKVNS